jgi:nitrogen fixation protein NifT
MKIMLRKSGGELSAYVAKKDLEARVVEAQRPESWGGWIRLSNGWLFELPQMDPAPQLPIRVEARRIEA